MLRTQSPNGNPVALDGRVTLRVGQLADALGVSTMSLWRWRQRPDFPRPIRTPTGGKIFVVGEVLRYLESLREAEEKKSGA